MKKLKSPNQVNYDKERKCCQLFFDQGSIAPSGDYYVRGGVCWPVITEEGIDGCVVVCGEHCETKVVHVFEEQSFNAIDHVLNDDHSIAFTGVSTWLNRQWTTYFCDRYFWNQEYETNKRWLLQVIRSKMIQSKPQFLEIDWQDDAQAMHAVLERAEFNRLIYRRDGGLFKAIEEWTADHDKILPPLHALMCCLVGIERYPWRRKR